jgi:hypothetical protein
MKTTSWVSVAVVCAAVAGAGGQNPTSAPSPREKPTDAAWLPKPGSDPKAGKVVQEDLPPIKGWATHKDLASDPPSAFPDLGIPIEDWGDRDKRDATFKKLCPRLFGATVLTIEATDDTLRKLLKARLHQGTLAFQDWHKPRLIAGQGPSFFEARNCLAEVLDTATELWAGQPKELVPWLEEFVIASKHLERYTRVRVETGTYPLSDLHAASRLRLKMEAELWKAKNPK